MWKPRQHVSVVLTIFASLLLKVIGKSGVWLNKLENCDPKIDYDLKFNITIRSNGNKQYADGSVVLKSPLDDHILSNVSVEMLVGNTYAHVLTITERKSCQALHKYTGEFTYDLERQAQLIPGKCPWPKGRHQVHNVLLNYEKITTMANFPFGNLRFKEVARKTDNSIYACFIIEIENYGYF